MRSLPKPDRSQARNDLEASVTTFVRRGQTLGKAPTEPEAEAIIKLYDAYDEAGGQAVARDKDSRLCAALLDSIRNAFNKTHGGALRHMRKDLLDPSQSCPICGIGWCEELDHFLPKADFGAFAIYARNLVPLCHTCNNTKLARGAGETSVSQFVHAYFEPVPSSVFLAATIDLKGSALNVEFGVDPAAGLSQDFAARLAYQFEQLRLNDRYAKEVNVYGTSHSVAWWLAFDTGGPEALKSLLENQAAKESAARHLNDWRACLLRGLSGHEGFCKGGFGDAFPK